MKTTIDKLWTIENVADFCQVKPSVVKYWLYNTDIPFVKLGKHPRFDPMDLKEWIEKQKNGCNDDKDEFDRIK